jgi:hypothetical protein
MKSRLQKHTLLLREGDYNEISTVFAPKGIPAAEVIRKVISDFVDRFQSEETPTSELEKIEGATL